LEDREKTRPWNGRKRKDEAVEWKRRKIPGIKFP
jgi:hypothetical protein